MAGEGARPGSEAELERLHRRLRSAYVRHGDLVRQAGRVDRQPGHWGINKIVNAKNAYVNTGPVVVEVCLFTFFSG